MIKLPEETENMIDQKPEDSMEENDMSKMSMMKSKMKSAINMMNEVMGMMGEEEEE